jgi:hypothetical protein
VKGVQGFQPNNELWRNRKVRVNKPRCKYCKGKLKRIDRMFCSPECYTKSGRRVGMGKVNGAKAYKKYWLLFTKVFLKKYGDLPQWKQVRLLIQMGQKKAYKDEYKKKLAILAEQEKTA